VARDAWSVIAILLVSYPKWDVLANVVDGTRGGDLAARRTQAAHAVASLAVVAAALPNMTSVLSVSGDWAILDCSSLARRCGAGKHPAPSGR
jgi:hypothetical protein